MKCPNCNAEIKEGSIICPICNAQFAFTGSDNFINLPDDEFVIKNTEVEEYVDPYENEERPVDATPGTLNLKTNKQPPKKIIKKVVKVNTKPAEEEAVEISPSVHFDPNDEATLKKEQELETTVVNVGGFTNTIVDATSAMQPQEQAPATPSVTTSNMPPVQTPVDNGVFAPTTNQAQGIQLIQNVDVNTNTIGEQTVIETKEDEGKPRKKMNETMMISFIMGLIVLLLCLIVYILLQNKNNPDNVPTTTTMTTFNCEENDCSTTTTTTAEATTTTKAVNQGTKSSLTEPVAIGTKSLCTLYDSISNTKTTIVDVTLDKIFSAEEAENYMKDKDNRQYRDGLAVGVLQYTLTGNELNDGQEIKPLTNVAFYTANKDKQFTFNGGAFYIGFIGSSNEQLTKGKSVTVVGYYNYPADQPPAYVCIGDLSGTQACYNLQ